MVSLFFKWFPSSLYDEICFSCRLRRPSHCSRLNKQVPTPCFRSVTCRCGVRVADVGNGAGHLLGKLGNIGKIDRVGWMGDKRGQVWREESNHTERYHDFELSEPIAAICASHHCLAIFGAFGLTKFVTPSTVRRRYGTVFAPKESACLNCLVHFLIRFFCAFSKL